MSNIIYNPLNVGKIINNNSKTVKMRKHHLDEEDKEVCRKRWEEQTKNVDITLKEKAGKLFFNPYRHGIYHYQIQSLFLLGCNEWHNLKDILKKMEEYVLSIDVKKYNGVESGEDVWNNLVNKKTRENTVLCKDFIGRVKENFILFQRLSKNNPYGYKLHQVGAALDIKRVSEEFFSSGLFYYRLSTYPTMKEAFPIRDYKEFILPKKNKRYFNKFIGTIITKNKTVRCGF